jgi:hypothetical protein
MRAPSFKELSTNFGKTGLNWKSHALKLQYRTDPQKSRSQIDQQKYTDHLMLAVGTPCCHFTFLSCSRVSTKEKMHFG